MPNLKRELVGPKHPDGPSRGADVVACKRGFWRYFGEEGFVRPDTGFDPVWNLKTVKACSVFQKDKELKPTGRLDQETLDALWEYIDARGKKMYEEFEPAKEEEALSERLRDSLGASP
jgi:hypothetical protein